jgi:hypothetical protein
MTNGSVERGVIEPAELLGIVVEILDTARAPTLETARTPALEVARTPTLDTARAPALEVASAREQRLRGVDPDNLGPEIGQPSRVAPLPTGNSSNALAPHVPHQPIERHILEPDTVRIHRRVIKIRHLVVRTDQLVHIIINGHRRTAVPNPPETPHAIAPPGPMGEPTILGLPNAGQ